MEGFHELFLSQILGFDILLMKNLKPVLLEVNSNPSMRIEHEQEVRVTQYSHSIIIYIIHLALILHGLCVRGPGSTGSL